MKVKGKEAAAIDVLEVNPDLDETRTLRSGEWHCLRSCWEKEVIKEILRLLYLPTCSTVARK
ncbi:Uncharacterized protein APZ42_016339 [Daphnia magna]|uniref:Uncharacterized protein n=1 Tax=Daphnia magna TaxID=35525 RepID=A0A165ACM1_9CRUS|nr:Uncharacterized protein APZ42_016339 [Daphnia magna]